MFRKFALLLLMLLWLSCTRQLTQPQTMTISGSAHIQGGTESSDISVSLYHTVDVDTTLQRLQQQFPTVGFELTQSALFDHRLHEPAFTAKTDAEGYYEFVDIPQGDYNVVVEKNGYGWRTIYDISDTQDLSSITLFPEIRVAGVLDIYTEWPAFQHVIVTGDVTVPKGSTLLIDKGATIRFTGKQRIRCEGQLNCFGTSRDMIYFTSNDVNDVESLRSWLGVDLNGNGVLSWVRFNNATDAITVKSASLNLSHCQFENISSVGIFLTQECQFEITNSHFLKSRFGISVESISEGTVHHSLFYDLQFNDESVGVTNNACEVTISDNCFYDCAKGMSIVYGGVGDVTYNYIANCDIGVYNFTFEREAIYTLTKNTVENCAQHLVEMHHASTPIINYNNFSQPGDLFALYAYSRSLFYYLDIDATHNYWGGLSEYDATRKNKDDRKVREGEVEENWHILIAPILESPINDAYPR